MALADIQAKPPGILCPMWTQKTPGSKRCAHYLDNAACDLPTELMCVEWMIRNHDMPKLEDDLRAGRYETPDQFSARFRREATERAIARGAIERPAPQPVPPQLPPPTMSAPPNRLAEALAKLQTASSQSAPKTEPAPAKPSGGLTDALARLNALKK